MLSTLRQATSRGISFKSKIIFSQHRHHFNSILTRTTAHHHLHRVSSSSSTSTRTRVLSHHELCHLTLVACYSSNSIAFVQSVDEVFKAFNKLTSAQKKSIFTYMHMIKTLTRLNDEESQRAAGELLLQEMRRHKVTPNHFFFNTMASLIRTWDNVELIHDVIAFSRHTATPLPAGAVCILGLLCTKLKQVKTGHELLVHVLQHDLPKISEMRRTLVFVSSQLLPNVKSFQVLASLIRQQVEEEGKESTTAVADHIAALLSYAASFKVRLDEPVAGTLAAACRESGDVDGALAIVSYALKGFLKIDQSACGQLMQTLREQSQMKEAIAVLDQLPSMRLKPSIEMICLLLAGCVEHKMAHEGLAVFAKFLHIDIAMESSVPQQLRQLLEIQEDKEKQQQVIESSLRPLLVEMKKLSSKVLHKDTQKLSRIMCLCMACGDLASARKAFSSLPASFRADAVFFSSMAALIRRLKLVDIVAPLLQLAETSKVELNTHLFNMLLAACVEQKMAHQGLRVFAKLLSPELAMESSLPLQLLNLLEIQEDKAKQQQVIESSLRPLLVEMKRQSKVLPKDLSRFMCLCMACGDSASARKVFSSLPSSFRPDAAFFSSMAALIRHLKATDLVQPLLELAEKSKVVLDIYMASTLASACRETDDMKATRSLLSHCIKDTLTCDQVVCGQLMQTLREQKQMKEAIALLDQLPSLKVEPNIEMFCVLLAGCVERNMTCAGLAVFAKMIQSGIPLTTSIPLLLLKLMEKSTTSPRQVHKVIKESLRPLLGDMKHNNNVETDTGTFSRFICLCLVCNDAASAHAACQRVSSLRPDATLISALCALIRKHQAFDLLPLAVELSDRLQSPPSSEVFAALLATCADCRSWPFGSTVYERFLRSGLAMDASIFYLRLHLMAKSGRVHEMRELWRSTLSDPTMQHLISVEAWNSLIGGYAESGMAREAIDSFNQMAASSTTKPDDRTFTAVLTACSHVGWVDECRRLFDRMPEFSVEPNSFHYACLVDALARAGRLQEALELAQAKSPSNLVAWMALLGACRTHRNVEIAQVAFATLKKLSGSDKEALVAASILLEHIYARAGRVEESDKRRGKRDPAKLGTF